MAENLSFPASPSTLAPMDANEEKAIDSQAKLIGDLTVGDAQHILACEGGRLSAAQYTLQFIEVVAITSATAWAIITGRATAWHLALPMVAQYAAVLLVVPISYLLLRHPGLKKDAIGSLRLWAGLAAALVLVTAVRGFLSGRSWVDQLESDVQVSWKWIADANMHWPIVIAFLCELIAVPGRVRNLYVYGPPFSGVSLGCAMRLVV